MTASDISKLAAGVVAGSVTHDYALGLLTDSADIRLFDKCVALGAGSIAGAAAATAMDVTGMSSVIDDVADMTGVNDVLEEISDTVSDLFSF